MALFIDEGARHPLCACGHAARLHTPAGWYPRADLAVGAYQACREMDCPCRRYEAAT